MKMFKIVATSFKVFYVEADDREAALNSEALKDETSSMSGEIEWEFDEARAEECSDNMAEFVKSHPKSCLLLK